MINAGDKVELELLYEKLKNNKKEKEEIYQKYKDELEKNNIYKEMIVKNIEKLIGSKL